MLRAMLVLIVGGVFVLIFILLCGPLSGVFGCFKVLGGPKF